MTKPVGPIVSAVLTLGLACAGASLPARIAAAADDCAAGPKTPAPAGQHWYYRTDRTAKRRCWYLAPLGQAVVKASPKAKRAQPTATSPVPANAEQADVSTTATVPAAPAPAASPPVTAAPPVPVAAAPPPVAPTPVAQPQRSLAAPPDDVWKAVSAAMERRNQAKPVDTDQLGATMLNVSTAPDAQPQGTTAHNATPERPSAFTAMENPAPPQSQQPTASAQPVPSTQPDQNPSQQPPTISGSQMVSLTAAALICFAVIGLIWQISSAMRRRRDAKRRVAKQAKVAAPQLAPSMFDMEDARVSSTFDIREVPPLPPMEPINQAARTRELLGKLLRDVENRRARQAIAR